MNDQKYQVDRRELMIKNVRESFNSQATNQSKWNYLDSCEKHGGELAEVARPLRGEIDMDIEEKMKVEIDSSYIEWLKNNSDPRLTNEDICEAINEVLLNHKKSWEEALEEDENGGFVGVN